MEHVVFDAEPLIVYYWDGPESDDVEAIIDRVEDGELKAIVNMVMCAEVRYICRRDDPQTANAYITRIRDWCDVVTAEEVWESAADYKRDYAAALGDAYTPATTAAKEATAHTSADDDFGDIDIAIRRFREEGT